MTKALNLSRQLVFQTECTNPRVYVHLLPIGNNLQINILVQICKSICLFKFANQSACCQVPTIGKYHILPLMSTTKTKHTKASRFTTWHYIITFSKNTPWQQKDQSQQQEDNTTKEVFTSQQPCGTIPNCWKSCYSSTVSR